MVHQHALMESISANLHGFLHQINRHMKKPDKKFLRKLETRDSHLLFASEIGDCP